MPAWLHGLAFAATLLTTSAATASPCEVAVEISGDPALVATVRELLAPHDAASATEHCPVVRARVERRGDAIAVVRVTDVVEERVVSAPETAAAVIESWSRSDLEDPLLALTPAPVAPSAPAPPAALAGLELRAEPIAAPGLVSRVQPQPAVASRRIQVFAAMETSFAEDQTSWTGALAGVCIPLGRICASARFRYAAVTDGAEMWHHAERHSADLLFGGDVPVGLGRTRLSVGFGAGIGSVHTRARGVDVHTGSETFGLRADAHAAWLVPISSKFAIDLSASVDLAQVVDVEVSQTPSIADEPTLLGRLAAGLRYGWR